MIEVVKTKMEGLCLIQPKVYGDHRGYFVELHNQKEYAAYGMNYVFVQDNQSHSKYGTIRGLHFQKGEYAQAKLLRVISGCILDVVVDLRPSSPTFKQSFSVELNGEDFRQLLVPRGFAHGFIVLSEFATVVYKCDNFYAPESEGGIHPQDPELQINWQVPTHEQLLSDKDNKLPPFREVLKTLSAAIDG